MLDPDPPSHLSHPNCPLFAITLYSRQSHLTGLFPLGNSPNSPIGNLPCLHDHTNLPPCRLSGRRYHRSHPSLRLRLQSHATTALLDFYYLPLRSHTHPPYVLSCGKHTCISSIHPHSHGSRCQSRGPHSSGPRVCPLLVHMRIASATPLPHSGPSANEHRVLATRYCARQPIIKRAGGTNGRGVQRGSARMP